MDDEYLTRLAIEAQQHPSNSKARRLALTQLTNGLLNSGRLVYPRAPGLSPEKYRDYRAEALQNLFYYICQEIDRYDSDRAPVLRWVNVLLDRRFFREVSQGETQRSQNFFPQPFDDNQLTLRETQRLLDEDQPFLSERVRRCLEDDLDGCFRARHLKDRPTVTFQRLALRRLDGYQWREISEETGIKTSTLSDFYRRCLQSFAPIVANAIRNLEY